MNNSLPNDGSQTLKRHLLSVQSSPISELSRTKCCCYLAFVSLYTSMPGSSLSPLCLYFILRHSMIRKTYYIDGANRVKRKAHLDQTQCCPS